MSEQTKQDQAKKVDAAKMRKEAMLKQLKNAKSLSDVVALEKPWDITHKELLDENFIIMTAKPMDTQFGASYLCDVYHNGKEIKVLFGATVLVNNLSEAVDSLPISAKVIKPKRSYLFADPDPDSIVIK